MKKNGVLVRCYLTESRSHIPKLMERLRKTRELRGITITTADAGLGTTQLPGNVYDPPVILECFDTEDRAEEVVATLRRLLAPRHVLVIPVTLYT